MKTKIQTITLALLGLIFLPNVLLGQLYEVSLDEKIEQSTLIVEGKVVESQCYRADNGDIYTANKVELVSILKGDYRERFLTITTWGGEMDGEMQTWTHLLTLDKGDYGIFFLEPTRVPAIANGAFPALFDVYSGVQGYLAFVQNDARAWVADEPFHTYTDIPGEIFEVIHRKTGQSRSEKEGVESVIRSGIRYHFTNIGFNGTSLTFDVYVNSLIGTKKLYKSGIQLGYNPVFFGSNIATSGNLSLQDAGISVSSTYDLTQSNVTSNEVKVELVPVGALTGLTTISTTEQLLAKGTIIIQNIAADPGITYSLAAMQAMSKFYDGGVAQVFDTVIVEGNWRPTNEYCKPVIKSFSPDSVAGGIGQILTIKGQCFGPFADNFSWVFFTDASKGIDTIRYTEPIIGEYKINCGASSIYCWSDTMIQVKVHSVSKVNGVSSIAKYAGSGKIQVWNFDGEFGESTTPLYVNYSALDTWTTSTETPSKSAIPVSLQDANDHEGMTLTIGANLDADTDAKNAFIRALNTWKCATKVNFNLDPTFPNSDSVCLVDYGALATGVLGSVKNGFQTRCKYNTGGEFIKAYRKKFDLIFSNSVPFFKLEDLSAFGILEYDLQTVALHELGHSHLLNHVNQEIDVMYAKLDKGISKRDLSNGDIAGGSHIMTISGYTYAGSDCNAKPMLPADVSGLGCSTDIKETENEQQCFKMFPNPAYAQVTIHLCDYTDVAIVIYNAFGKQVLYQNYNNINSVVTVNVESLPSGTYFVKIKSATNSAITTKMIKI